jgi:hypothetical protein
MRQAFTRRALLVGVVAVALGACGGDGGSGPSGIAGTYTLASVNGQALPFTFINVTAPGANYRLDLLSGRVTVNADGTYTMTHRWRENDNGAVFTADLPDNGTYSRQGDAITFTSSDGETDGASLSGGTIIYSETFEGQSYTYRYVKS